MLCTSLIGTYGVRTTAVMMEMARQEASEKE